MSAMNVELFNVKAGSIHEYHCTFKGLEKVNDD
jgi:hypothetical protein